ncbi:MFS transporter [Nocardia sp. NPDC051030]|uniref:MFS transporter n=1 Tax=Nocardia sp. NPDC051030 TaxID=3155162 RepID=UPI003440D8FD
MTAPREPGADSDRWGDEETPLIDRHPGFDRYPPANTPNPRPNPPRPNEPEVPDFLARRNPTRPYDAQGIRPQDAAPMRPGDEQSIRPQDAARGQRPGEEPTRAHTSRWSRRRRSEPPAQPESPPTRPLESQSYPPAQPPADSRQPRRRGPEPQPPVRPGDHFLTRPDPARSERPDPATRELPEAAHPQPHSQDPHPGDEYAAGLKKPPRKLTVTRVAVRRSKELTERGFATFQRAAKADGAEESGLTALVYATMANFATDAAVAVALANTLFFASATAESKTKVALYLLITIAPFAVIAPLIGPALDRLQRGRRLALAGSFAARVLIAGILIFNVDTWALYPLALCMMILSKSFAVLKSAVTPRVLPPGIDLVRTNSRLTVFGLVGGTLGAGAVAGLIASVAHSAGALLFAAALAAAGAYLSLQIPSWVEVTEGEVPATLTYHGADSHTEVLEPGQAARVQPDKRRQPLGRAVVTGLWGNGTIRVLTGFLTFYVAFVAKATEHRPTQQAAMLAVVGVCAAVGNFAGNASGARMKLGRPTLLVLVCTIACVVAAVSAAVFDNLLGAAAATLIAAGASALAKVSLDAAIQDDLPEESIASGFGRSETVLQLSWVIGGSMGVLLPTDWWKGFAAVSAVMALGLVQTVVSYRGHSLLPGLGGNRPQHAKQEIPGAHGAGEPT